MKEKMAWNDGKVGELALLERNSPLSFISSNVKVP